MLEVNPADWDGKVQLNARDRGGNVAENLLEDGGAANCSGEGNTRSGFYEDDFILAGSRELSK